MGTNFYYYESGPCPTCGHLPPNERHIGKSSAGWCFSLHVYPEDGINDLPDWLPLLEKPGSYIRDEYGKQVSVEDMLSWIRERFWDGNVTKDQRWYEENHAVPGPKGLVRHRLDSRHCVGHGEGTWDRIIGEFS